MTAELKLKKPGEVRVRIAPSPTGFLHIGLARTALFNYLFAKQCKGSFVLRVEDTDIERSDPAFEKDIIESLKWLGLEWSEGPIADAQKSKIKNQKYIGNHGPYRQSERLDIYSKYIKKLLDENKAYYCFCSEQDLEAQRQYQMSIGQAPSYSGKCANLDKETIKKYLGEGKPSIIRFRVASKKIGFNDLIRGRLEFDTGLMGDIVIAKNISAPLYNFAVVVDDYEMKISHVIRGEDHISNTPKQILIQRALGFPQPEYAHLPLILGADRTKLSKRHAAVAISEYRKQGYLPETLINFMAFLGWNPGDEGEDDAARDGEERKLSSSHAAREREIYSLASLVKEFSMEKVQKGGAVFNVKRLDFLNGFYIRHKSADRLTELCIPFLKESGLLQEKEIPLEKLKKITVLYQERLKKLSEISELADFFFKEKLEYDKDVLKWKEMSEKEIGESLENSEKILSNIKEQDWLKENLENVIMAEAERAGDRGQLLWPLRAALTGKKASAGPIEIAEILGKEETLKRLKEAKGLLSQRR
ncbi:MAG: glutamate--tRNA ligase [bacterium]